MSEVAAKTKGKKAPAGKKRPKKSISLAATAKFPRHSITRVLRVPQAILDQNAGKDCTEAEAAKFVGVGYHGPFRVEISSALKFGLLERPQPNHLRVTELAKRIIRPHTPTDKVSGLREAVLRANDIREVYENYRGENLPDRQFFENALEDKFGIPHDQIHDFIQIFNECLEAAELIQKVDDRIRILDVSETIKLGDGEDKRVKVGKDVKIEPTDTCFVMMPFGGNIGTYYEKIYKPAIEKTGLKPVRADNEIFGTGKIIDQICQGITAAKVLVAELTTRNPNVFYELGLAHALQKPVVLIAAEKNDVPFDLQHIRVIYYDLTDPFWGQKLLDKVAENVVSALQNPSEAILPGLSASKSK
ncbi:MAG: hypothetical protein JWR15_1145 [Prosthecobacter sp.]|nr:hypothetical protein [Prosthecobacter sp.]